MRFHAPLSSFSIASRAWLVVCLCWPAFACAQERAVFTYADANQAKGCFAFVSGKDWIEYTGSGEALAFQEMARNADYIELFDTSRGGVGVRLFANDSQWKQAQGTEGKWAPLWSGSWKKAVDLRADFLKYGLKPRVQGKRDTCSVFTTVGAIELGLSRKLDKPTTLSVEFLNWASNQVGGNQWDGSFFVDCLDGFRKYGLCPDAMMPHPATYDPNHKPSSTALATGEALRREVIDLLQTHWIMPPGNGEPGLTDRQFAEVKATLARGYPVAFGSGHSILLVGYQDNAEQPGGGEFLVKDSNHPDFITTSYEHVRTKPYDVFWVDFRELPRMDRKQWAFRLGIFKQVEKGNWTEFGNNGNKYFFKEVTRKADYVELYEQQRELTLRIYGATYSKMFYKTPNVRTWRLMYDGKWIE